MREKNRKRVLERVSEALELPGELMANMPKLTMTGNRRLHIEGHKGILQHDSDMISVNGVVMLLKVHGDALEIVSMSAEELLIAGRINSFEFEDI